MKRILDFIKRERLYLLILMLIVLVNFFVMQESSDNRHKAALMAKEAKGSGLSGPQAVSAGQARGELIMRQEEMKIALARDKSLAVLFGLSSLLIIAVFLLGLVIDMIFALQRSSKEKFDISTYSQGPVKWGIWDVARVVILFLFFGYMVVIIESFLLRLLPALKNDNFRMMVNTSILDIMAVVFILHFTVSQYKEKLASLGLSVKNLKKNMFYGVVGYIAAVPVLVAILAVIAFIVNVTKYIPEKQPVVELFLKEQNQSFLIYTSLFTAVVGPFIEELFFRGFMYNAFKKRAGIFWAMLITSSIFASLHTNVVGFVPILVLGMLLAYMYEKTGTLVAPITIHVCHNLSMVFFVFLMKHAKV